MTIASPQILVRFTVMTSYGQPDAAIGHEPIRRPRPDRASAIRPSLSVSLTFVPVGHPLQQPA